VLDGHVLIDVHQHPVRRSTLTPAWRQWAHDFGDRQVQRLVHPDDDAVDPAGYAAHLRGQGVDIALGFSEYSPKTTGIQPVEDVVALVERTGGLVRLVGNINPHYHFPLEDEVARQVDLGAVAIKLHPVHGGFHANDRELYPAYERCQALGVPVIVHCGTSTFPGSHNRAADPVYLADVLRDFRTMDIVLAHGGRGWWYDAAAFLALTNPRVWIDLSGLPPRRLPDYYARHSWDRLVRRFLFGTDWPGVPSISANARAVAALCPDEATAAAVLGGNARQVFGLAPPA